MENKTKKDFSPKTRHWLIGLKNLRKLMKVRLSKAFIKNNLRDNPNVDLGSVH